MLPPAAIEKLEADAGTCRSLLLQRLRQLRMLTSPGPVSRKKQYVELLALIRKYPSGIGVEAASLATAAALEAFLVLLPLRGVLLISSRSLRAAVLPLCKVALCTLARLLLLLKKFLCGLKPFLFAPSKSFCNLHPWPFFYFIEAPFLEGTITISRPDNGSWLYPRP